MPPATPHPALRTARPDDVEPIRDLMRASVLAHFPRYYDAAQTASGAAYTARPDPVLIEDGTFFVHEVAGGIVACGGWSRRGKLYAGPDDDPSDDPWRLVDPAAEPARIRAMFVVGGWARRGLGREIVEAGARAAAAEGFTTLALVATLPGVPLYTACGFADRGPVPVVLPDGARLGGRLMDRPVLPPG